MRAALALFFLAALAACAPGKLPSTKVGKPYVVDGQTYYPSYDGAYDRTGEASWYGPGFHGSYTASGEVYDQNDYTAAHPTLPMPSIVRVTSLASGKSLLVRINDRGPFKSSRIIDLSKKSAQALGIRGVARVRVQYLEQETQEYLAMVQENKGRIVRMAAFHDRVPEMKQAPQPVEPPPPMVAEAAPIMTVDASPVEVAERDLPPASSPSRRPMLIREAAADEVPPPEPAEPTPAVEQAVQVNLNDTITESPAPVKAQPATANGGYAIQAGSFASEANAHKLAKKLARFGKTSVNPVENSGRQWWQVRVVGLADRQSAESLLQKIHADGVRDARVVRP